MYIVYNDFKFVLCCMHCDIYYIFFHMFVEVKALQGLCLMFIIFDVE